jgi:Spy/CpxP family protein refolding chaperone
MTTAMTKRALAAGTLALAFAAGSPALGRGLPCSSTGRDVFLGGGRMLHALDLSADQKQQVQDILTAHRTRVGPPLANEKAARKVIADKLLSSPAIAQQDLDSLVQQESETHAALVRERLAVAGEVRNLLTPAQLQKAATIRTGMAKLHVQMHQLLGKPDAD